MKFKLLSDSFNHGDMIPQRFTCESQDISPPLTWLNIPDETVTLALIADDPDAPNGTWVHWVMYNIPRRETGLPEKVPQQEVLDFGAKQGVNDFKKVGYGGPCPPNGLHHYYFKLYALDTKLNLEPAVSKEQVEYAMQGHILAEAQLMGVYQKG